MKHHNKASPMEVLRDWLDEIFPLPVALIFLALIIAIIVLAFWAHGTEPKQLHG